MQELFSVQIVVLVGVSYFKSDSCIPVLTKRKIYFSESDEVQFDFVEGNEPHWLNYVDNPKIARKNYYSRLNSFYIYFILIYMKIYYVSFATHNYGGALTTQKKLSKYIADWWGRQDYTL